MKRIVLLAGVLCSMGMGYAQKLTHPDLLYTPERIEQVKQRIGQDEQMTSAWKEIKQTAEKELKGNSLNKADYLSLAYLMTGEKVYADKTLGYSQDERFDIPDDFDPCKDKLTEIEEQNTGRLDDDFFQ